MLPVFAYLEGEMMKKIRMCFPNEKTFQEGFEVVSTGQRSCAISESQPYPSEKADPLRPTERYDDWP